MRKMTIGCTKIIYLWMGILLAEVLFLVVPAEAQISLPRIFSDGMVLQRNANTPIWGKSSPGTTVFVQVGWSDSTYSAVTNSEGNWLTHVRTPQADSTNYGPYTLSIIGENQVTIHNVVLGEVWLNSGQSNMYSKLFDSAIDYPFVQEQNTDLIRVFDVGQARSDTMVGDVSETSGWKFGLIHLKSQASPTGMEGVSAVGYHFADTLRKALGVPVGMLSVSTGGSYIEEWCQASNTTDYPEIAATYVGKPAPGDLYNAMLKPLAPYKISGFLWYQGESNADRFTSYLKSTSLLIQNWRTDFQNPYLPFYLVQLPMYGLDNEWKEMRIVQEKVIHRNENTEMVVTVDVGDIMDLHPQRKRIIAFRLANLALSRIYGRTDLLSNAPVYRESRLERNTRRVFFDYADRGLKTSDDLAPKNLEVAGANRVFYPANARIEGSTLVVFSTQVVQPEYVRYFQATEVDQPNFFSTDGLPVAPFDSSNPTD